MGREVGATGSTGKRPYKYLGPVKIEVHMASGYRMLSALIFAKSSDTASCRCKKSPCIVNAPKGSDYSHACQYLMEFATVDRIAKLD